MQTAGGKGFIMSIRKKRNKTASAKEFDEKFEAGEDVSNFMDFDNAVIVKRVNVDFPTWMIQLLDREAVKLNVSRQAIIKLWISERLKNSKEAA